MTDISSTVTLDDTINKLQVRRVKFVIRQIADTVIVTVQNNGPNKAFTHAGFTFRNGTFAGTRLLNLTSSK